MEKSILVKKGTEVSKIHLLAELLSGFNELDLIIEDENQEEFDKIFGATKMVASKEFIVHLKIETKNK